MSVCLRVNGEVLTLTVRAMCQVHKGYPHQPLKRRILNSMDYDEWTPTDKKKGQERGDRLLPLSLLNGDEILSDFNLPGLGLFPFGNLNREKAILIGSRHLTAVHILGQP